MASTKMKTVGEILKEARLEKGLRLELAAQKTKIRPIHLRALEKNNYQRFDSPAVARGFIKNYAEFLGLSSKDILAIYRRDFDEKRAGEKISRTIEGKTAFGWTPKLTTLVSLAIFLLLFIAYLVWQYRSLVSAPYY